MKQQPLMLSKSNCWRWLRTPTPSNCKGCILLDKRIFELSDREQKKPPLHPNCACYAEMISSVLVGTATQQGINGADWHLKHFQHLPAYYITKEEAYKAGWRPACGNLNLVAPGKMIGKSLFHNIGHVLPSKDGRIWYEADINYISGYRNAERILYSSDGLLFVTYDHYKTFYQIL